MNHFHENSISSILIQGYIHNKTSPRFTTSRSSHGSVTKAEMEPTEGVTSQDRWRYLSINSCCFKLLHLHFTALLWDFNCVFLAGKRIEGRLEKSILGHRFCRSRYACETEPHVHELPFGMTHLWNDCQEEEFVYLVKIDSAFCRTADALHTQWWIWPISTLKYIKIKSFYTYSCLYSSMSFEKCGYRYQHQYTELNLPLLPI